MRTEHTDEILNTKKTMKKRNVKTAVVKTSQTTGISQEVFR